MSSTLLTVLDGFTINVSISCIISSGVSVQYRNRVHEAGGLLLTTMAYTYYMLCHACAHALSLK